MKTLEIRTDQPRHAVDITDAVFDAVGGDGFVWLSCPHTTAALILSEVDEELLRDIERTAAELLAPLEPFTHRRNNNPNAAAHLLSSLMGTTLLLRISDDRIQLGTYQRIVLVELDGPKVREVHVDVIPTQGGTP